MIRDTFKRIASSTALRMARVFGSTLDVYRFAENGDEIEDVPCLPSGLNNRNRIGLSSQQDLVSFFIIPISNEWPLANTPKIFDHIVYDGLSYFVTAANFDNLNSRWKISVTRRENI